MWKLFTLFSQFLNVLMGGASDETLSARSHREQTKWEPRIDKLLGSGHCAREHAATRYRQLSRYGVKP